MRRTALLLELALSLALVVMIGMAAWKFARVLERLQSGRPATLAFALVFGAAALFAGKRALSAVRRLRSDGNDDDRIPRKR